MAISAGDVIPLSQARANLSELADQVKAGAEKIITKNGESYVALIDADRLDYYRILNGFIQSLVGLYDYTMLTHDPLGQKLFEAGDAEARAAAGFSMNASTMSSSSSSA